jgi:hypothetical protein
MHESYDYEVCSTGVVWHPPGHAPDALNPDFQPDLVMDIRVQLRPGARCDAKV